MRLAVPGASRISSSPSGAKTDFGLTTFTVTRASFSPGFASASSRVPLPAGAPSRTLDVVGSACAGSQSELLAPDPSSSAESSTDAASRPREVSTCSASSSVAARPARGRAGRDSWPGTVTPRRWGTSITPERAVDGDVGDGRTGVRVDQLEGRVVPGAGADRA